MSKHQISYRGLVLVIALFLMLGTVYSVVVPIFEAPDEVFHFFVVHHIKEHGTLPNMNQREDYHWEQEGSQPPLYYLLGYVTISQLDTGDAEDLLWLNPQRNLGDPGNPGNKNYLVHTESEQWPYQGTTLAVHMLRWLSLLIAAGSIAATYHISRLLFPDRPILWLGASSLQAFIPQFIFISSTVNNDNLNTLLASLALWQLLLIWKSQTPWRWTKWMLLGLTLGAAVLTKLSSLALVALTAAIIARLAWKQRRYRQPLINFTIAMVLLALISGWWFARNWQLYSDLTGLAPHLVTMGGRDLSGFSFSSIWGEFVGLFNSFWGLFAWFSILMPGWTYIALAIISVLAFLAVLYRISWNKMDSNGAWITLLWLGLICASLVRWTLLVEGSQGRLLFPALPVIVLGLAYGITRLGDSVFQRKGGQALPLVLALGLLALSTAVPFTTIQPWYTAPEQVNEDQLDGKLDEVQVTFGNAIRLIGCDDIEPVRAGDTFTVTCYWKKLREFADEPLLYHHLIGVDGEPVAKEVGYPGSGAYPVSRWPLNQVVANTEWLRVTPDALGPVMAELLIGVELEVEGESLNAIDPNGRKVERVVPEYVRLNRKGKADKPQQETEYSFGDTISLTGYSVEQADSNLELALYWNSSGNTPTDLTVFAHLLDSKLGILQQADSPPVGGRFPTSEWQSGDLIRDTHQFQWDVEEDGECVFAVGLYNPDTDTRLPVRDNQGTPMFERRVLIPCQEYTSP